VSFQELQDCCTIPNTFDSGTEEMCIRKFGPNQLRQLKETTDIPKGNCVAECIANATKIYRGGGLIDKVQLTRLYLNSVSGERAWEAIVSSAVDLCMSESELLGIE